MRRRSSNIYHQLPLLAPCLVGWNHVHRVIARLRKSQNWNLISKRVGQPIPRNWQETEKANIPFLSCIPPPPLNRRIIRSTYLSKKLHGRTAEKEILGVHRSRWCGSNDTVVITSQIRATTADMESKKVEREREKKRREESEDSGQRGGSARRDKRRKKKGKKKDIASSVDKIQTEIEEGQCIM